MIIAPPAVSLGSWWRLAVQDKTLLRSLEDDLIARIQLRGKTLDIGGGATFDYVKAITVDGSVESVNMSADVRPTFVADLNAALPFGDAAYDNVICFNTLEHVLDERAILNELLRVLRPGGRFVITVPFLFRRHGNYGDFHRHTAEFWEHILTDHGIASGAFQVQPLVWSPLSSALATLPWFRGGLRGRVVKLAVLAMPLLYGRQGGRPDTNYALGYYIDGWKLAEGLEFEKRGSTDITDTPGTYK